MLNYTQNLSELNKDSLAIAGGKGANLGELIKAGLPVPPGFIVTSGAYRGHLEASGLKERISARLENLKDQDMAAISDASTDISAWIEAAPMNLKVQEEIVMAWERLAEKMGPDVKLAVAVRSSATAEDLPSASFAGQHDTYLGIYGKDTVLEHVKKCWASLWSSQAISYRISMGFDHLKIDLAVVVQVMIAAEAAGVMFTANPVNGNCDEILISAGYGLGETVVSGLITPDTFILNKEGYIQKKALGSKKLRILLTETGTVMEEVPAEKRQAYCLGMSELKQLCSLADLVEKHYGSPMDTEWALLNAKIYLLQARPITTMKSAAEDRSVLGPEDKIIYQGTKAPFGLQSVMEHCSEPMTPLDFALCCCYQGFNNYLHHDMGLRLPKEPVMPVERDSGCVAIKYNDPRLSPAMLWKIPQSLIKNFSKEAKDIWQPLAEEMDAWLARVEDTSRSANDAEKCAKFIEQAFAEYGVLFGRRMSDFIPSAVTYIKYELLLRKAVDKNNIEEFKERLMRGLPFKTALQNEALVKVAQVAALHGKDSQAFQEEFNRFLEEYRDRPSIGMAPTLGSPTWREKPEIIQELIDALLGDPTLLNSDDSFNSQKADYEDAKRQIAKRLKPSKYLKFEQTLEKARDAVIVREEGLFYLEKLTAGMRRLVLKLGSLLAERSVINEAGDVFFLFAEELRAAASGKLDIKARIEKRKNAYKKVCAAHEKGVHWIISTGSFPVFAAKKKSQKDEKAASDSMTGISASRGVYEGPVCIVMGPAEFNKVKKGDILVSAYTAPVWTPLFRVASAVVTEIGSAGSHAAIVSREYGIPCVVAIDNVTNLLRDGQRIRVDGTKGIVTLLES